MPQELQSTLASIFLGVNTRKGSATCTALFGCTSPKYNATDTRSAPHELPRSRKTGLRKVRLCLEAYPHPLA